MVRGVRPDEHHVARDGRRPDLLGIVQELDRVQARVAKAVRDNNRLVLGEVGRGHLVPFVFRLAGIRR